MQTQVVKAAFFGLVTGQAVELIVVSGEVIHGKAAGAG